MLWTVDDFLAADFPEEPAIIKPLFPTGGIMLIHGQQTSGKTQLALDIALCVARGDPFLDIYPCERGPVVYFQFDQPRRLFQSRIRHVQDRAHSQPLYVVSDFGYHDIVTMSKATRVPKDIQIARELRPVLVVFDSFQRCHTLDENLAGDVKKVYDAMHRLFPDANKVTLHHENKKADIAASHKIRGNAALLDDANCGIQVKRLGRGEGGTHRAQLVFTKVSTMEEPKPLRVLMDPKTLLLTREQPPTTREIAQHLLWKHPEMELHDLIKVLLEQQICSKSNAYAIAQELGL